MANGGDGPKVVTIKNPVCTVGSQKKKFHRMCYLEKIWLL
jgi:hypothetical protein